LKQPAAGIFIITAGYDTGKFIPVKLILYLSGVFPTRLNELLKL
jgi:hypothetical protein